MLILITIQSGSKTAGVLTSLRNIDKSASHDEPASEVRSVVEAPHSSAPGLRVTPLTTHCGAQNASELICRYFDRASEMQISNAGQRFWQGMNPYRKYLQPGAAARRKYASLRDRTDPD